MDKSPAKKLLYWYQWSNLSSTSFLNLIDYDGKMKSMELIPWFFIPFSENQVIQFCEESIFETFKLHILKLLLTCDRDIVPRLIRKLLHVCEVYNIKSRDIEASSLYYKIIECLCDRYNDNPNVLLDVWNVLCSNSDSAKMEVFKSLDSQFDRRRNVTLLKFILKNAQIVRFGFWGAWVKNNDLDKYNYCPVTSALVNGNVEQMTILLQYGFKQNSENVNVYDNHFLNM